VRAKAHWLARAYEFGPGNLSKAAAAVHRKRHLEQSLEAVRSEMFPSRHRSHDSGELFEVEPLRREQRNALEKGNNGLEEGTSLAHDEDERPILLAVRLDVAALEALPDDV
jgi:hypothetical protein